MLAIYNPGNIFDGGTLTTIIIFLIIGIFIVLISLTTISSYYVNDPNSNIHDIFTLGKGIMFLGYSFTVVALTIVLYFLISYNFHVFLAVIGVILIGGVALYYVNNSNNSSSTKYAHHIKSGLSHVFQYISTNKMGLAYIATLLVVFWAYITWDVPRYNYGGDMVTDSRTYTPLNVKSVVSNNKILNNGEEINYNYGFSFWVYIDSTAQNTQSVRMFNILNYGSAGNPHVVYDGRTNSLKVLVYEDDDKYRVIYTDTNFLLQKWHQIAINYDGGQIDVFIDGELMASKGGDVPYLRYNDLVVGEDDGAIGDVKNIIYFKNAIPISTIRAIYNAN